MKQLAKNELHVFYRHTQGSTYMAVEVFSSKTQDNSMFYCREVAIPDNVKEEKNKLWLLQQTAMMTLNDIAYATGDCLAKFEISSRNKHAALDQFTITDDRLVKIKEQWTKWAKRKATQAHVIDHHLNHVARWLDVVSTIET